MDFDNVAVLFGDGRVVRVGGSTWDVLAIVFRLGDKSYGAGGNHHHLLSPWARVFGSFFVDCIGDDGRLWRQLPPSHEPTEVGSRSRAAALALKLFHSARCQVFLVGASQQTNTFRGIWNRMKCKYERSCNDFNSYEPSVLHTWLKYYIVRMYSFAHITPCKYVSTKLFFLMLCFVVFFLCFV